MRCLVVGIVVGVATGKAVEFFVVVVFNLVRGRLEHALLLAFVVISVAGGAAVGEDDGCVVVTLADGGDDSQQR